MQGGSLLTCVCDVCRAVDFRNRRRIRRLGEIKPLTPALSPLRGAREKCREYSTVESVGLGGLPSPGLTPTLSPEYRGEGYQAPGVMYTHC